MTNEYWLKMIGAADREVGDRWIEARPRLLKEVRFPKTFKPTGIRRGDLLVYYAAGDQKLFSIVKAKHDGTEAQWAPEKGEERWPWLMEVQTLLAIPQLALAPHWSVLGLDPGTVQQKSHVAIGREKYQVAQRAMAERTAEA
jgi:hypothetical protein